MFSVTKGRSVSARWSAKCWNRRSPEPPPWSPRAEDFPVWRDNMARMNAAGFTIYLRREAEQIARRLSPYGRQKRPRLRGLGDAELVEFMSRDMAAREPFYAQAQLIVDCGELSDDEVVETILRHTMQNE